MARHEVVFDDVTFCYDSATAPLFAGLSVRLGPGWTGVLGANGAGKTTLLALAAGALEPTAGSVRGAGPVIVCPQRTDDPPARLADFAAASDHIGRRLAGGLGLGPDWPDRWATLSHGERKRAQIGTALWERPQVLAVDEPTNHLDRVSRDLLVQALRSFRGVGLIVSHDRDLLDDLCARCLLVEPPAVHLRDGGYTKAVDLLERERREARERHERARGQVTRLEQEANRRRQAAASADSKRSKRKISRKDHDARSRIDAARVSGKDGQAGRLQSQMRGRLDQARDALDRATVTKTRRLGVSLPGRRSQRDAVVRLEAGTLALGARVLEHPDLVVAPDDRVALAGPNGAGKSTLIRRIVEGLEVDVVYVAQEVTAEAARHAVESVRGLPGGKLGELMTIVSCLGSHPERLLDTDQPSPGETRKLLLALGALGEPALVVMDEPTNHLDLPSIECLETALSSCPAALLLVSHDERFLAALTRTRWTIAPAPDDDSRLVLSVSTRAPGGPTP